MARKRIVKKVQLSIVDIVIPVLNGFEILDDCLKAIPDACGVLGYKVIIFDNGSDREKADQFYTPLMADSHYEIIRSKTNLGFPRAVNTAARKGASPLILLLNSDVVLDPGSIVSAVNQLDDPKVGVCGFKLLFPENTPSGPAGKVQHIGIATTISGGTTHIFCGWSPDNPKVKAVKDVFAVTGAALLTRRNLWKSLGGLDEIYGMGTFEDVDYCMKVASMAGGRIIVDQGAIGTHYTGYTSQKMQRPFNQVTNEMIFKARWAGKYGWTLYQHL